MEKVEVLMGEGLKDMLYQEYYNMLRDPRVKEEVCMRMHDNYHREFKPKEVIKMEQLVNVISEADKDLFIMFRDNKMTFD